MVPGQDSFSFNLPENLPADTKLGLGRAVELYNQALARDTNYAQAYRGLADTYALLADWQYAAMTPPEALPRAKAAATRALEFDDSLSEAHTLLAFTLDGFDWDLKTTEQEFQRAIEFNLGYATARHWYAWPSAEGALVSTLKVS